MDSDRLNRWLTLGANLGVLVGLVVLIVEIGQNTEMMRAQMVQARADTAVANVRSVVHSDYWPKIWAKRAASASTEDWLDSLTPEEQVRVLYEYLTYVNDLRNQFYQYQEGYLPPRIWHTSSRSQMIRMIDLASALGRGCGNRDPDFVAEVKRIATEEGLPRCNDAGEWEQP